MEYEIDLLEGESLFKTREEQRRFQQEFYESVKGELDRNVLRRIRSEVRARSHRIY